jgi:DamX protein
MTDSPDQDASQHKDEADNPELARFLHSESPRRPSEPDPTESLRRPPPPPGDPGDPGSPDTAGGDMRDMEKSLVERIADVDDDRRRTAVQMRKALETHRDEIRAQRHRDHTALLVLTGIGIILLAAVLLLFSQLFQVRDAMQARIADLETAAGTPASDVTGADARDDLAQRVTRLEQQADAAAEAPADDPAQAQAIDDLTQRLGRLERQRAAAPNGPPVEDVDELADAIEAIGDRLTALEGRLERVAGARSDAAAPAADTGAAPGAPELAAALSAMEARLEQKLAALSAGLDGLRERLAGTDALAAEAASAGADAQDDTLTTDPGTIALQLASFPERDAIDRFIAQHSLPAQVYLTVNTWRGGTWYGLVHSLHPDMDAAETARDALPPDLGRLDIWLRPLPAGTRLRTLDGRP